MSFLGIVVKSGSMSFGYSPLKDGINNNKIKLVLLAKDLSYKTKDNILFLLENKNIEYININETMLDISLYLGKYSGILGIKDENMASRIKELINEDDSGRNLIYDKIQSL